MVESFSRLYSALQSLYAGQFRLAFPEVKLHLASEIVPIWQMTEEELESWHRDDLRIRAFLDRQFGGLDTAARASATAAWFTRLRQRADLP